MSEEKFSKCEEGKKKNVSVKFRVFGKKNWKKSSGGEKKSKWFGVEILLSSCSLVGLYVNLQVKVMEKEKKMKVFKVYFGWVLGVNVATLLKKVKLKEMLGLGCTLSWASCCETWLEFEITGVKVAIAKKIKVRDFYLLGSYPLVGRHVVNEPKVGCFVVNEPGVS